MKNPYIAGLWPVIDEPETRTAEEFLKLSGNNLGNFMFVSSVRRLVRTTTRTRRMTIDLPTIAADCDGIVIPAANWLQPKNDFSGLAAGIEKADVPCVITGIGAQAHGGKIPELQPGTVRLLKVVSERSHAISVRGPFSAEVLNHYGIQNVAVTGCPSLLWHLDHPAAVTRLPHPGRIGRVTINGTVPGRTVPRQENARMRLGKFILQQAVAQNIDYVTQTELHFLRGHRGELPEDDQEAWEFLHYVFDQPDRAPIREYLDRHIRAFPNVPEWQAYCANHDLVLGTRLHGVIAGLLAGAPGVLITHDSRTEEMGRFAGIPTLPAATLLETGRIDPEAILAQADFDAFNARQRDYFRDFIAFFDANEVPHRLRPPQD